MEEQILVAYFNNGKIAYSIKGVDTAWIDEYDNGSWFTSYDESCEDCIFVMDNRQMRREIEAGLVTIEEEIV